MKIKFPKIEFDDIIVFFFMWAFGIGMIAYLFIYIDSKDYSMANWQNTCRWAVIPALLWVVVATQGASEDEKIEIAKADISAAVKKTLDKNKVQRNKIQETRYKIEKS